jgi:hypothetical protein
MTSSCTSLTLAKLQAMSARQHTAAQFVAQSQSKISGQIS